MLTELKVRARDRLGRYPITALFQSKRGSLYRILRTELAIGASVYAVECKRPGEGSFQPLNGGATFTYAGALAKIEADDKN